MCMLRKRYDPYTNRHRWSLSMKERCGCQAVMMLHNTGGQTGCHEIHHDASDLWFTDDVKPLVTYENWKPKTLDELLDRVEYCGKSLFGYDSAEIGLNYYDFF